MLDGFLAACEPAEVTMPKKGSRPVHVEGADYRWRVRPGSVNRLTVSVESAEGGRTLVLVFDLPPLDNWLGEPGVVAKPADVAAGIAAATKAGWDPSSKGGPLFYQRSTGQLRNSLLAEKQGADAREAPNDGWEAYDPSWLVRVAEAQQGGEPWLADALAACTRARVESEAMIHFLDPHGPAWDFDTNIILESESHGDLVLDVLKGQRIGGVEFLSRL